MEARRVENGVRTEGGDVCVCAQSRRRAREKKIKRERKREKNKLNASRFSRLNILPTFGGSDPRVIVRKETPSR